MSVAAINQALSLALSGQNGGYLRSEQRYSLTPIQLKLDEASLADWQQLQQLPVASANGGTVPLSELVIKQQTQRQNAIYRKDLRPVVFVTADLAGGSDSPLYGMLDISARLQQQMPELQQQLINAPEDTDAISIKWDGEWQITYETFRDMGLAYGVGLIMIYLLVVAQFKSYGVPLIIMAPIPLTLIGIMPGHYLCRRSLPPLR